MRRHPAFRREEQAPLFWMLAGSANSSIGLRAAGVLKELAATEKRIDLKRYLEMSPALIKERLEAQNK